MSQVNRNKTARSATTADIVRVIHKVEAMRERSLRDLDGLLAELRTFLPPYEDQARYQRIRSICRDRAQLRAVMKGEIKI